VNRAARLLHASRFSKAGARHRPRDRPPRLASGASRTYGVSHVKRSRCVTHQVELGTGSARLGLRFGDQLADVGGEPWRRRDRGFGPQRVDSSAQVNDLGSCFCRDDHSCGDVPGMARSRQRACLPRQPSTTCGTPSPAPLSPKASRSPRFHAGSATGRSRQPWTSTGISSPKPAVGLVTHWTRHSRPGSSPVSPGIPPPANVPGMCPVGPPVSYQYRSQLWAAGESACRPGSVHPLTRAGGHPSGTAVADSLVRSTHELGRAAPKRSRRPCGRGRKALLTLLRVGFT
jgi:hypothetical protein